MNRSLLILCTLIGFCYEVSCARLRLEIEPGGEVEVEKPSRPKPGKTTGGVAQTFIGCDCDISDNGCTIRYAAPPGQACKCQKLGRLTCTGALVACKNPNSPSCKMPDKSYIACLQGGGDCNGYKCDCDYKFGGCVISSRAERGSACKCHKLGWWKCRGQIVQCRIPNNFFCMMPDKTAFSCMQGGGDCRGYMPMMMMNNNGAGRGNMPMTMNNNGAGRSNMPMNNNGADYGNMPANNNGAGYGNMPMNNNGGLHGNMPMNNNGGRHGDMPMNNNGGRHGNMPMNNNGGRRGYKQTMMNNNGSRRF